MSTSEFSSASISAIKRGEIQEVSEIAGSDLDGLKYLHSGPEPGDNLTFNNTLASIFSSREEHIASSWLTYNPSAVPSGGRFVIKNVGGKAVVSEVS